MRERREGQLLIRRTRSDLSEVDVVPPVQKEDAADARAARARRDERRRGGAVREAAEHRLVKVDRLEDIGKLAAHLDLLCLDCRPLVGREELEALELVRGALRRRVRRAQQVKQALHLVGALLDLLEPVVGRVILSELFGRQLIVAKDGAATAVRVARHCGRAVGVRDRDDGDALAR